LDANLRRSGCMAGWRRNKPSRKKVGSFRTCPPDADAEASSPAPAPPGKEGKEKSKGRENGARSD
jgi:hypothetical protein